MTQQTSLSPSDNFMLSSELLSACELMSDNQEESAPLWLIAYSGGLDSHVLLHSMLAVCRSEVFLQQLKVRGLSAPRIEAVHVDHGLQESSGDWARHCQQVCDALEVPLHIYKAKLGVYSNVEAAARQARYQLFAQLIRASGVKNYACVFLAQHQQDQVETFLYRLMRGAGLRGLQGMPKKGLLCDVDVRLAAMIDRDSAFIYRPVLNVSQPQLQVYATEHSLTWVEDPSNADTHFDRNFLRRSVIPLLLKRWPHFQTRLAKNIEFLQQSQSMLNELAKLDLQQSIECSLASDDAAPSTLYRQFSIDEPCFPYGYYVGVSEGQARCINALQYWLTQQSVKTEAQLQASQAQLELMADHVFGGPLSSKVLSMELAAASYELRSFKQALYLVAKVSADEQAPPCARAPCSEPVLNWAGNVYDCSAENTVFSELELHVGARKDSGKIMISGKHRKLKSVLQEAGVPVWARESLPYFYKQGELVAVGDIACCDALRLQGVSIIKRSI